ncbi:MAG: class I SAM-dependent methyltransferase [Blastococcus sp.]
MIRRIRDALRTLLLGVVQEGTRAELAGTVDELAALRGEVRGLHERVDALDAGMKAWERRTRRDVITGVEQEAMRTSAQFLRAEFGPAEPYFDKYETLRDALARAPQEGLFLEFGVASGSTLEVIVERAPAHTVYGFDSFEGLPEDWRPGFPAGAFATEKLPDVPGADLVVGLFEDTLPAFLEQHPGPVAFLHLDADLYSSTRTVLTALAPRLRAGTVIVFDEYFNFPGWEEHEHRAWTEFVAEHELRFEYLGYTADDEQVVVRLLTAPSVADDEPANEASEHAPSLESAHS